MVSMACPHSVRAVESGHLRVTGPADEVSSFLRSFALVAAIDVKFCIDAWVYIWVSGRTVRLGVMGASSSPPST